jgi:hypothetical protein
MSDASVLDRLTDSKNSLTHKVDLANRHQVRAMQVSQQTVHGNMVHQVYDLLTGQLAET